MTDSVPQQLRVLRLTSVKFRTGLGKSTIYARMNSKSRYHDARFPKSVRLGAGAIGWLEHEIDEYIVSAQSPASSAEPFQR